MKKRETRHFVITKLPNTVKSSCYPLYYAAYSNWHILWRKVRCNIVKPTAYHKPPEILCLSEHKNKKMSKGTISVQTEDIFPIIKKFLYSEHEIFLRELVSNAIDATSKIETLARRGEFKGKLGDLTIQVILNPKERTLTIRDRGLGMTKEEVEKYLNQVAFSSAKEFLEKYKEDARIIGKFGLGFYSAFMVADKVEVVTKSYREDAAAVRWVCEGKPEYELEESDKKERGTDVILHLGKDGEEFLQEARIEGLLKKYCRFLPYPIQFGTRKEKKEVDGKEVEEEVPNIINNTHPLWKKKPAELSDEDYLDFYNELYPYSEPPLFWIHLNVDHPFHLTGVLYFPKLSNNIEAQKNKIQLYVNQVFVTDEVSQIIPEFLTLLHGVIDSPDIPLNVSRSYLQGDPNVRKIARHITKKVADKLKELFVKDRENFEQKWEDISVFIKYGMISDEYFYEKALDFALFKAVDGRYFTLEELKEKLKDTQTDKHDKLVLLYTNDPESQHQLLETLKSYHYTVLVMKDIIDNHFMQHLEYKDDKLTFKRIDADTPDKLIEKEEERQSVLSEKEQKTVRKIFEEAVKNRQNISVQLKPLSPEDPPVLITQPEFMRRMSEIQALQGGGAQAFPEFLNLAVNTNHPLIGKLLKKRKEGRKEMASYLVNLALLGQQKLKGEDFSAFFKQTIDMLNK